MHLAIDFGNSRTKAAIFDKRKLIHFESNQKFSLPEIKKLLNEFDVTASIISSVVIKSNEFESILRNKTRFVKLGRATKLPFQNKYKTPETLGADRLANLMGARFFFPRKNTLIISAGSCITYDVITSDEKYYGGNITAGLEMQLKAMNTFTARLPLVKKEFSTDLFGSSTTQSILTGVIKGTCFEMEGFIAAYRKEYSNLKIILTGGDASFFDTTLKSKIFAIPYLTLHGLNEILHLNDKENS